MLLVTRADGRRVFALGVAGLVPAALVTLLLVHQPSIGGRRLYPMLRGSLSVVGLALALATLVAWATDSNRLSRRTLSGLAWAGLTATLCIGPLLESTPRARLFALELGTGEVMWARKRAVTNPVLVDNVLVVTDVGSEDLIGLDPETGEELWRLPAGAEDPRRSPAAEPAPGPRIVDGEIRTAADAPFLSWPGETVDGLTHDGVDGFAYVSTPGADGSEGGSVVRFDVDDGAVRWRFALPDDVAVDGGTPALHAGGGAIVVAGGERIASLDAEDGRIVWSHSIASLGKSRGYVLPGSVQQVIVTDTMVFLLATPQS